MRGAGRVRGPRLCADGKPRTSTADACARGGRSATDARARGWLRVLPRDSVRSRGLGVGGTLRRLTRARAGASARVHALHRREPGARGTRRASGRVPLVELPRQRARRGRRSPHAAPALLFAGALPRCAPRGLRSPLRADRRKDHSSFTPAVRSGAIASPISLSVRASVAVTFAPRAAQKSAVAAPVLASPTTSTRLPRNSNGFAIYFAKPFNQNDSLPQLQRRKRE